MSAKKSTVDEKKDDKRLRTYVVVWCLYQLLLDWNFGGLSHQDAYEYLELGMLLLLTLIDSKSLTVVTFLIRCGGLFARMPNSFDAEYFQFITDLSLAVSLMLDAQEFLPEAMRWEVGIFYIACAFWKINTAFLNPKYSCGTTYAVQLVCMIGLPSLAKLFASIFPIVTIILEGAIGVAALFPRTGVSAAMLCLALHIGITFTPPPNNIAGFGVMAVVRAFWLLPALKIPAKTAVVWAVPSAAFFLGACHLLHTDEDVQYVESNLPGFPSHDWPAGIFGAAAAVLVVAILNSEQATNSTTDQAPSKSTKLLRRGVIVIGGAALMAFWAFGSIMLGLLDGASPNMFSNIRMSGGSNHLLLPTSLLQRWYYDEPDSVFGGGVLRIEASNSSMLNQIHPGELTSVLTPETRRVLTENLGYQGRFYNSLVANVVGTHVMPPYSVRPRYTVPAFELHRVLSLGGGHNDGPIEITLTKLEGPSGDEAWRRHSGDRTVTLVFSPFYPHLASCKLHHDAKTDEPLLQECDRHDLFHLTFLAAEQSRSWLNFVGGKLQMWNSYVLYEDDDDTELHCYGS